MGQSMAGILIQLLGVPGAVALDGLSFVASVTGTTLIRTADAKGRVALLIEGDDGTRLSKSEILVALRNPEELPQVRHH